MLPTLVICCTLCTGLLLLKHIRSHINHFKLELVNSYQSDLQKAYYCVAGSLEETPSSIQDIAHFFSEQANVKIDCPTPYLINTTEVTLAPFGDLVHLELCSN